MKVFVSYNRSSGSIVQSLVEDIEGLGHTVWFDRDLSGGQAWWERILKNIRECEVFAIVADTTTVNSSACRLEAGYAADLGKSILPVVVAPNVALDLLPIELSSLQVLDYTQQDKQALRALSRALANFPPPKPLPDPLPTPPEAPASHLGAIARKIDSAAQLTYEEQSALTFDLERAFKSKEPPGDTKTLLERMRSRRDLYAVFAERLDSMLHPLFPPIPPVPSAAPESNEVPVAPETIATQPSTLRVGGVVVSLVGSRNSWASRLKGAMLGGPIGLVLRLIIGSSDVSIYDNFDYIVFSIAGLLAGAAIGSDWRKLWSMLVIAISIIVGRMVFYESWSLVTENKSMASIASITTLSSLLNGALAAVGLEIGEWLQQRRSHNK